MRWGGEECEGDGEMRGVLEWECVREMGCEKVRWEGEMGVGEVCVGGWDASVRV